MNAEQKYIPRITLDWSKLLGFDQISHPVEALGTCSLSNPQMAPLAAKVGVKGGGTEAPAPGSIEK